MPPEKAPPLPIAEAANDSQLTVSASALEVTTRADFDVQIATAHKWPRSIARFRDEVLAMATLNEATASECNYALPRKDKNGQTKIIEGASIRFAEIIGSAWGNAHVATRVIADDGELITAQAVFHDLERNWRVMEEVQRRVTDKSGRRYSPDMIAVTANAARSIAMRNAILHGIPKAFWEDLRVRARRVAVGDTRSLATKRLEAFKAFAVYGVTEAQILTVLNRPGAEDITIEDLETLFGLLTSIKDGDATPESIFNPEPETPAANDALGGLNAAIRGARSTAAPKPAAGATVPLLADVVADIRAAPSMERLDLALDLVRMMPDPAHRDEAAAEASTRRKQLEAKA